MTEQHQGHHDHEGHDHDHDHEGHHHEGGGGGPHVHGVDPSDPEHRATPGAITDQAGLEGGSVAPGQIRNPIVPPDALPGD